MKKLRPNFFLNKDGATRLLAWFEHNHRDLPWRVNRDPYRIWISEVMLQQTNVTAVLPYYEKFIAKFPNLKALSEASIEDVYEFWAGLGYYSRARNLLKAAQELQTLGGFPKTAAELIQLPGFGPYTARAVSSLAFGEKVGVLDGNVIRVMSRVMGRPFAHWLPRVRDEMQIYADQTAQLGPSDRLNQAYMELGALVCLPRGPKCLLCPIMKSCQAQKQGLTDQLPLKKSKKPNEIWYWQAQLCEQKGQIAFVTNEYAPFLKKQLILPGEVKKLSRKPDQFDFRHSITHHDIFVSVKRVKTVKNTKAHWISIQKIQKLIPASLIKKALACSLVVGCAGGVKKTDSVSAYNATVTQLTAQGENFSGRFSVDSSRVLFLSRHREKHDNAQVYELQIDKRRDRRLTFHDGDDAFPNYISSSGQFMYASTTDENKERLSFEKRDPEEDREWPPYEIYVSDLAGRKIHRLTHHVGYDGAGVYNHSTKTVVFISQNKASSQVLSITATSGSQRVLANQAGFYFSPAVSFTGTDLAWIHTADKKTYELQTYNYKTKKTTTVLKSDQTLSSPNWHPDGKFLIFTQYSPETKTNDLFVVRTDGQCLTNVMKTPDSEDEASFAGNGKNILFTGTVNGVRQLFVSAFTVPKDCGT